MGNIAKPTLLIVEDEKDLSKLLEINLLNEGYSVHTLSDGRQVLPYVIEHSPNLIVLDVMLPGLSGIEVCKAVKEVIDIPILMVTAKSEEEDVVKGLNSGADDYVTKPFSLKIVKARIKALLRRVGDGEETLKNIEIGPIKMIGNQRKVMIEQKEISLTYSEFQILYYLMSHPNSVLSRENISNYIHKEPSISSTLRAIDTMIVGLRKKLGNQGKTIKSVRSVGYSFSPL